MLTVKEYVFWWGVLIEAFLLCLTIYYYRRNLYSCKDYSDSMRTCIWLFTFIAFLMWFAFVDWGFSNITR